MARQEKIVPLHEDPRYLQLRKGFCPSTGLVCDALGDLLFQREVSRDSFATGGGSIGSMTVGQEEAYERANTDAARFADITQRALNGDCRRRCVLKGGR